VNETIIFLLNDTQRPPIEQIVRGLATAAARGPLGVMLHRPLWFEPVWGEAWRDELVAAIRTEVVSPLGVHMSIPRTVRSQEHTGYVERAALTIEQMSPTRYINCDMAERFARPVGGEPLPKRTERIRRYVKLVAGESLSHLEDPGHQLVGCSAPRESWPLLNDFGAVDMRPYMGRKGLTGVPAFVADRIDTLKRMLGYAVPAWTTFRRTIGWLRLDAEIRVRDLADAWLRVDDWRDGNGRRLGGITLQLKLSQTTDMDLMEVIGALQILLEP